MDEALRLLAADDPVGALAALVAAWPDHRDAGLADQIDRLSDHLAKSVAPVPEKRRQVACEDGCEPAAEHPHVGEDGQIVVYIDRDLHDLVPFRRIGVKVLRRRRRRAGSGGVDPAAEVREVRDQPIDLRILSSGGPVEHRDHRVDRPALWIDGHVVDGLCQHRAGLAADPPGGLGEAGAGRREEPHREQTRLGLCGRRGRV